MSFKALLSIVTLVLIVVILYFSREELIRAWGLLSSVNLWILFLMIPGQILVYYVGGEMMFSYLRAKGTAREIPAKDLARMALEMNFVNHVLPSGGVSGISYMTWRLGKYKISPGRAAMAQLVRFSMTFIAFIALLILAVIAVTIDGNVNRWIIFISFSMILGTVILTGASVYVLSNRQRMWRSAGWLVRVGNKTVRRATFGRKRSIFKYAQVEKFFTDMHFDFIALRREKSILTKPFLWGIAYVIGDVGLYLITFWAMGIVVNPAPVLIAYGVAITAGMVSITPGGTGVYEAVMIGFLALAGMSQGEAIAGVVLARVILLFGTIVLGYAFYQDSILKNGKHAKSAPHR